MEELFKHRLKNGELIIFKTNVAKENIQNMPDLSNQYQFCKYFRDRGYQLEIHKIMKPAPYFKSD